MAPIDTERDETSLNRVETRPTTTENHFPTTTNPVKGKICPKPPETSKDAISDGGDDWKPEDTGDFVMDQIISHKSNRSSQHIHRALHKTLYPIRWYDYGPSDDTWEPTANLASSNIVSFYKKKNMKLPDNIDDAIDG